MILNPNSSVPQAAHIKLEIYYPNELEHFCSQDGSLMALNDTFSLQEMNMDTKDLSSDIKAKELEVYSNNKCVQHPADNHCKVFMIIT